MSEPFDIYLAGVGGQGVLMIGEIITETAYRQGIPVNFYPTKGMAQRGGFVKAQLRLGRSNPGATIAERGADVVIATEVSESLKAVRFIKPGGDFILFAYVWSPTAVMLGKASYPALSSVLEQVARAGANACAIDPVTLPAFEGAPVADNIFTLGVALSRSRLGRVLDINLVAEVVGTRWKRGSDRNLFALRAGLDSKAGITDMKAVIGDQRAEGRA